MAADIKVLEIMYALKIQRKEQLRGFLSTKVRLPWQGELAPGGSRTLWWR